MSSASCERPPRGGRPRRRRRRRPRRRRRAVHGAAAAARRRLGRRRPGGRRGLAPAGGAWRASPTARGRLALLDLLADRPALAAAARLALGPAALALRAPPRPRRTGRASRRRRAHEPRSVAPTGQVGLEQVGGGQRVGRREAPPRALALGHPRRQPLVVGLDRDRRAARPRRGERARRGRLLALGAVERDRQADDDQLGALARRRRAPPRPASGGEITPSGRTIVPLGSQIAVPARASPWSIASTRIGRTLRERPPDRLRARSRAPRRAARRRGRPPGRPRRARPRRRRPTAAASRITSTALRPALDRARAEARDQRDLAVVARAEDDRRVAALLLDPVGEVEQPVLVALRRGSRSRVMPFTVSPASLISSAVVAGRLAVELGDLRLELGQPLGGAPRGARPGRAASRAAPPASASSSLRRRY